MKGILPVLLACLLVLPAAAGTHQARYYVAGTIKVLTPVGGITSVNELYLETQGSHFLMSVDGFSTWMPAWLEGHTLWMNETFPCSSSTCDVTLFANFYDGETHWLGSGANGTSCEGSARSQNCIVPGGARNIVVNAWAPYFAWDAHSVADFYIEVDPHEWDPPG